MMNEGESPNVKSVIAKHKAGLLSALKARKANPEDSQAYNKVKKHLETIATELGLDSTLPFMEDEMYSGEVEPLEAIKHTEEMFNSWVEDSKMMNENEDSEDMYSYDKEVMEKGKVRQLKSKIIDAIDMIDPELHVETFAKVIANIVASEYGEHLYEDFLNALKAQTGSMTEGKEVVRQANRIVESWKRGKALVESKKAKRSKMLKENEDDDDESHGIVGADYLLDYAVSQFPQLVKQYGEEAVRLAFDVIYENSWHNYTEMVNVGSEDAEELAQIDVRKSVRQFKENPEELAQLIEDTMNDFNSSTT
jgi:hypothetical protein